MLLYVKHDHGVDVRDLLAARAIRVALVPHATSYFSEPKPQLDPNIFDGLSMKPAFRRETLTDVMNFLSARWKNPEAWCHLWLAGSSASYQWAGTDPGDLDLLVGIEYDRFRRANPGFYGLSDTDISSYMNREFQKFNGVWGHYDRTLYSNAHATDIRSIHPYAAFDIIENGWTVAPDPNQRPPDDPQLAASAAKFTARAGDAVAAYSASLEAYRAAPNDAERLNAAVILRRAADAAAGLYEEVHRARRKAFSPEGKGYSDPTQYAWQAAKASGAVPALRTIADERRAVYGNPHADADRVLIEAALYRRKR